MSYMVLEMRFFLVHDDGREERMEYASRKDCNQAYIDLGSPQDVYIAYYMKAVDLCLNENLLPSAELLH